MALNSSGPISLAGTTAGQSIEIENGGNGTTQISLNDAAVRSLAGVASGAITMPTDFWGKSNAVYFVQYYSAFPVFGSSVDGSGNMYLAGMRSGNQSCQVINAGATTITQKWFSGGGYISGNYAGALISGSSSTVGFFSAAGIDLYTASTLSFSPTTRRRWNTPSGLSFAYGTPSVKQVVMAPNGTIYAACGTQFYYCCSSWESWGVGSLTSAGAYNWFSTAQSANYNARCVTTDSSSNVYSGGISPGNQGGTWIKFNSSGTPTFGIGLIGVSNITGIAVDSSGNVYTCGEGGNSSVAVITKQNSSGTILWSRFINYTGSGGIYRFSPYNIALDSSNNVYVLAATNTNNNSFNCLGLVKYNTSGVYQWGRKIYSGASGGGSGTYYSSQGVITLSITPSNTIALGFVDGGSSGIAMAIPTDGSKTGTYAIPTIGNITYESFAFVDQINNNGTASVAYTDVSPATSALNTLANVGTLATVATPNKQTVYIT